MKGKTVNGCSATNRSSSSRPSLRWQADSEEEGEDEEEEEEEASSASSGRIGAKRETKASSL